MRQGEENLNPRPALPSTSTGTNMYKSKAFVLFLTIALSTSSVLLINQSHTLALNTTNANTFDCLVLKVKPPVTLHGSHLSPDKVVPIDPPSVYMCAIENLAPICRRNPRHADFSRPLTFTYGAATIRFEKLLSQRNPFFTYNTVCATLRGLAECMTSSDWWVESFVSVFVDGTMVGTAQIWNPLGESRVAPVDTVGVQYRA